MARHLICTQYPRQSDRTRRGARCVNAGRGRNRRHGDGQGLDRVVVKTRPPIGERVIASICPTEGSQRLTVVANSQTTAAAIDRVGNLGNALHSIATQDASQTDSAWGVGEPIVETHCGNRCIDRDGRHDIIGAWCRDPREGVVARIAATQHTGRLLIAAHRQTATAAVHRGHQRGGARERVAAEPPGERDQTRRERRAVIDVDPGNRARQRQGRDHVIGRCGGVGTQGVVARINASEGVHGLVVASHFEVVARAVSGIDQSDHAGEHIPREPTRERHDACVACAAIV